MYGLTQNRPLPNASLISMRGITVRFGGILALDQVGFDVPGGMIYGVIGPNGAGKTTLFNCLSRLYPLSAGDILFEGRSISRLPVHAIAGLGIGRTFQNLALFGSLSVERNILVGAHCRSRSGFVANALRLPSVLREESALRRRAAELIDYLQLGPVRDRPAASLPFAVQKRVELGRALAAEPRLLLLDEPAAGLNPEEMDRLGRQIVDLRDRLGITVLLVEHHMSLVMAISDRIAVLNFGRKIADGHPAEVRRNPEVIAAYLGSGSARAGAGAADVRAA